MSESCKCIISRFIGTIEGNNCITLKTYGYDCFGNGPDGTESPCGVISKNLKHIVFGTCRCNKLSGWLYLTDKCNCGIIYSTRLRSNIIVDINVVKQRIFTWNPIFKNMEYSVLIKNRIQNFILCFGKIQNIE